MRLVLVITLLSSTALAEADPFFGPVADVARALGEPSPDVQLRLRPLAHSAGAFRVEVAGGRTNLLGGPSLANALRVAGFVGVGEHLQLDAAVLFDGAPSAVVGVARSLFVGDDAEAAVALALTGEPAGIGAALSLPWIARRGGKVWFFGGRELLAWNGDGLDARLRLGMGVELFADWFVGTSLLVEGVLVERRSIQPGKAVWRGLGSDRVPLTASLALSVIDTLDLTVGVLAARESDFVRFGVVSSLSLRWE